MINHIQVFNMDRQTGKTTRLLKILNGHLRAKSDIHLITFNREEVSRLIQEHNKAQDYLLSMNTIQTYDRFISYLIGKNLVGTPITVLIDEPFLLSIKDQQDLLEALEINRNKFNVIGVGTLENHRKDFSHYISNNLLGI